MSPSAEPCGTGLQPVAVGTPHAREFVAARAAGVLDTPAAERLLALAIETRDAEHALEALRAQHAALRASYAALQVQCATIAPPEFGRLVAHELAASRQQYPRTTTSHEAHSIILEELDEYWAEVKRRPAERRPEKLLKELVQVAAMCQRAAEDLALIDRAKNRPDATSTTTAKEGT